MSGTPPTPPADAPPPRRPSIVETVNTTDGFLRHAGREFLVVFYTALRSLKLYPIENAQVQKALDDLHASARHVLDVEPELELRLQGEFIYVNSTRLRLALENYASFSHVLAVMRQCGVGTIRVEEGVDRRQLQILVSLMLAYAAREASADKIYEIQSKLVEANAGQVFVDPPVESEEGQADSERAKEAAKRTYARSVAVTREVINSLRMGRTANVKRVKRAVQTIVDQVLNNESSLLGLTTLRDYDEYTFTHSVNVCIFSVALGRKLGLSKLQLYDLGMAALFHDVGKSRVPLEVLNKEGGLSEDEWRILQAHPWLGVLTLFGLRGYGEIPYRGMIVAFEHHMKTDLTGYPKSIRPRSLSIFSKVIAVADGFDAATSRRIYQTIPIQPDQVLKEMWENPRRGYDPVVVKAFINLIGVYPVGTCVILDTYEVAIVHAANTDVSQVHRPMVRVVASPDGAIQRPGELADLALRDEQGGFPRTIVKVTDPEKYGIKVSDYFV
ncbi:MAG TPA: HD domain-containing phosphohydrolase [Gemmatimonadales bacterium]|jgi:HD-GYP domain-containing protein (c-di-GMP phosphodiesterase class II)